MTIRKGHVHTGYVGLNRILCTDIGSGDISKGGPKAFHV